MKKIVFVVYPLEITATILFILTVVGIIRDATVMFYVIWFMGLLMSAFSAMRDIPKDKTPNDVFPPLYLYIIYGLGIFQVVLLIAMFFPQLNDFSLALIISFAGIAAKWCVVHGYKLYSLVTKK